MIIGRAQLVAQTADIDNPNEPVQLMTDAARAAVTDAGIDGATIDTVGVVGGLFRHPNPGRAIADQLGATEAQSVLTTWGGNTPIAFVGELGDRLARGETSMALMAGGETGLTRAALRKASRSKLPATVDPSIEPAEAWGAALDRGDPTDLERGGEHPRNTYAVFESALRAAAGESLDTARQRAADLWAGFSAVAATNPDLDVTSMTADDIREPSSANRMVSWPYTKAMCANNTVDHAGALIMTTHQRAEELGIAPDQRVYLRDTVVSADTATFVTRADVASVPGLDAAIVELQERWGDLSGIEHVDLYGCFPSMVAYTAHAMGLRLDRELTVTGGLGFMGAPLNFAAGQALIAMVRRLRADPGSHGLVQGNGGHASKHALGVFSTTPPDELVVTRTIPAARGTVDRADHDTAGAARVDGITVEYDHSGPSRAVALCRFLDGEGRMWATSSDPEVFVAATTRELVGVTVQIAEGQFSL